MLVIKFSVALKECRFCRLWNISQVNVKTVHVWIARFWCFAVSLLAWHLHYVLTSFCLRLLCVEFGTRYLYLPFIACTKKLIHSLRVKESVHIGMKKSMLTTVRACCRWPRLTWKWGSGSGVSTYSYGTQRD